MKATLIFREKARIQSCFVLEMVIYRIDKDKNYPDQVKYSLILINAINQKRVLMDNHHPKGHHVHLDQEEFGYEYVDEEKLISDFKDLALRHMGVKL